MYTGTPGDPLSDGDLHLELGELYRLHAAGLLRYANSLAHNADSSRDAVQEAFLRYFVERRVGRTIEHPGAWLYVVIRNYLLQQVVKSAEQTKPGDVDVEAIADGAADPEAQACRLHMAGKIATILSARETECLHLRLEGLGYAEIAEVLGIQSGTVGALLARVRAKLRRAARGDRDSFSGLLDSVFASAERASSEAGNSAL